MCRLCSGLLQGQVLHLQSRCDALVHPTISKLFHKSQPSTGMYFYSSCEQQTTGSTIAPGTKAHEDGLIARSCMCMVVSVPERSHLRAIYASDMCCMQSTYMYCISRQTYTGGSQSNLPMETQAWMSFTWRIRVLAVPTTSLGP
jgi:hypothetical protein